LSKFFVHDRLTIYTHCECLLDQEIPDDIDVKKLEKARLYSDICQWTTDCGVPLALTNRPGGPAELVHLRVEIVEPWQDILTDECPDIFHKDTSYYFSMRNTAEFLHDLQFSQLQVENPDPAHFPKFYRAKKMEVVLDAGDCLFLPAGWWHWVFSEDAGPSGLNIALNFWYKTEFMPGDVCTEAPMKSTHDLCQKLDYLEALKSLDGRLVVIKSDKRTFFEYRVQPKVQEVIPVTQHVMTFDEFQAEARTKPAYGMYSTAVPDSRVRKFSPKLQSFNSEMINAFWWINNGDVTSSMHYDIADNFLCQLEGRKRILLFHPDEHKNLYPFNPYDPKFAHSLVRDAARVNH
jgi:hypothetical protein